MNHYGGTILLNDERIELWEGLRQRLAQQGEVAGLFRGWKPAGYEACPKRILYVGQATSGSFHEQDAEAFAFNGKGNFWAFAKQLPRELGLSTEPLTCIAWSNISKVSRPQVEADPSMLNGFEDEAVSTLEYEIDLLNPTAIVFAASHFNDFVVRKISQDDDNNDCSWNKSENEICDTKLKDIWWKRRKDGIAAIWMPHPGRVSMGLRNYAAAKIALLA